MLITEVFLMLAPDMLTRQPEFHSARYSMFNTGSTEVEVAEFLYALVNLIKAEKILETGTHYGISAAYMAKALKDHIGGRWDGTMGVTTLEVMPQYRDAAIELWKKLRVIDQVDPVLQPSVLFETDVQYDLIFLDSEPQYRFDEFVKFWPNCRPGGFILIHDLHTHLGHTGETHHHVFDWPYGDFREKIGPYIKSHDVQVVSFGSPRGFTLFQKVGNDFSANRLLKGEI